jgi:membrane fusion protein, heavy metal efflux system
MTPSTLAHGGHGNEFQHNVRPTSGSIQVDAETAQRLGLIVAPVRRQPLALSLKTTGQLETVPNPQVEVTTPIKGTMTRLLVQPGQVVQAG